LPPPSLVVDWDGTVTERMAWRIDGEELVAVTDCSTGTREMPLMDALFFATRCLMRTNFLGAR
jgi:hypothetical protein